MVNNDSSSHLDPGAEKPPGPSIPLTPEEVEKEMLDSGFEIPGGRPIPTLDAEPNPVEMAKRLKIVLQNGMMWHDGDVETVIQDLLANVRHLADAAGVDFYKALDRSYEYYSAEVRTFGPAKEGSL